MCNVRWWGPSSVRYPYHRSKQIASKRFLFPLRQIQCRGVWQSGGAKNVHETDDMETPSAELARLRSGMATTENFVIEASALQIETRYCCTPSASRVLRRAGVGSCDTCCTDFDELCGLVFIPSLVPVRSTSTLACLGGSMSVLGRVRSGFRMTALHPECESKSQCSSYLKVWQTPGWTSHASARVCALLPVTDSLAHEPLQFFTVFPESLSYELSAFATSSWKLGHQHVDAGARSGAVDHGTSRMNFVAPMLVGRFCDFLPLVSHFPIGKHGRAYEFARARYCGLMSTWYDSQC